MISTATSWADTTEVSAYAAAVRLKAVVLDLAQGVSNETFVQLWDVANPTPGTTAPRLVLPVPRTTLIGIRRRIKYVFPGGLPFTTALTWFVSTTHDGATAATTDAPLVVEIHFELL